MTLVASESWYREISYRLAPIRFFSYGKNILVLKRDLKSLLQPVLLFQTLDKYLSIDVAHPQRPLYANNLSSE